MEIRYYLRIFQRSWWLILISALVAVNLSLVYSYYIVTPIYETTARFIVSPNLNNIDLRDVVNSLEALDKRSIVTTYAEVLNSPQIIRNTIQFLGKNPANYDTYTFSVTVLPDANVILLSAQGPNPEVATTLVNSVGQYAINYIQNLYDIYNIDFLDKAVVPAIPIKPEPFQNAMLALLAGVVIGLSLSIFREQLSNTLEELAKQRLLDSESKAYTRAYFERAARQEIAQQSYEDILTLGVIQLTGIQDIYDSIPQAYLTRIMQKVTETLKHQLRGNDVIGRWSQMQFIVLLLSTDGASAVARMERIRELLDRPITMDSSGDFDILLETRIGLADRQGGESFNTLVKLAEKALEIAKQSENRINLYKVRPFD